MKEGQFLFASESVSWHTFKVLREDLHVFLPPFIRWNTEKSKSMEYGYTTSDYEIVNDPWKITAEQRRTLFQVCHVIWEKKLSLAGFEPVFCTQNGFIYIIPKSLVFQGTELLPQIFCSFASFLCVNRSFSDLTAALEFVNVLVDPKLEKFSKRLQVHGYVDSKGSPEWPKLSTAAQDMQRRIEEALDACKQELRRFAGAVTDEYHQNLRSARSEYEIVLPDISSDSSSF